MIILDTNVVSEVMRPQPSARVVGWLKRQSRVSVFTTTVTQGEILYGLRLLPDGQRRAALWNAALAIFAEDFEGRLLGFDAEAALVYAEVSAHRRGLGRPISQFDAMIAAIARSRGATLATRNLADFTDCGIELLDPWL